MNDLIESICLLQKEGFEISFVHRSFQEYFSAAFIAQSPAGVVKKYFDSEQVRIYDNVIPMIYAMAPERVESEWANNTVDEICATYNGKVDRREIVFSLDLWPDVNIELYDDDLLHLYFDETLLSRRIGILRRIYPAHFEGVGAARKRERSPDPSKYKNWREHILKLLFELAASGDPRLKDFEARYKVLKGDENIVLTIGLKSTDEALLEALGIPTYSKATLKALEIIGREQKRRVKGDGAFLEAVFGS